MFKHILVPTDGSQRSMNAAQRAVLFAKGSGAQISALYVKPAMTEYSWAKGAWVDCPDPAPVDEFAESDARDILGPVEMLCWKEGVQCHTVTRTSSAISDAIIDAAAENKCDLIVMASHTRRGIKALLGGSETLKVLTHSNVPLLVYR